MNRRGIFFAAVGLILAWELLAWVVARPILPPPSMVARSFLLEVPRELGGHFLASLLRVIVSIVLAIVLAVPLGLILGQSKRMDGFISPLIYLTYPIPKIVLVPIIILFLGVGDLSKITIIFLILFFQVVVLVRDQAAALRPELIQSVRSLGAGRRALFRYVYLPASMPAILTALRQSIGLAIAVLYITELFATQQGLGYYIYLQGNTLFNYDKMFAGVIAMSLLGLGLYLLVDWLQRRLCPWQTAG